jgi:amidase
MSDIDGKIQADYDQDFYHSTPVSLQMVGKRLVVEKMLEFAHEASRST